MLSLDCILESRALAPRAGLAVAHMPRFSTDLIQMWQETVLGTLIRSALQGQVANKLTRRAEIVLHFGAGALETCCSSRRVSCTIKAVLQVITENKEMQICINILVM